MGYSPGFLLKNGEFVTVMKSPQIDTESPEGVYFQAVSKSLERFPELAKIHHVQNQGFCWKTAVTLAKSPQIDTESPARS